MFMEPVLFTLFIFGYFLVLPILIIFLGACIIEFLLKKNKKFRKFMKEMIRGL